MSAIVIPVKAGIRADNARDLALLTMRCQQQARDNAPMDTPRLKRFCASFPAAEEVLHGEPSNILVYSVGGKTFAYFKTSEPERWRFSIRVTPERFVELTDQPGIKPARWMGRWYWVTVVDVRRMPEDYLRELVKWSYGRALGSLSGKRRRELVGG